MPLARSWFRRSVAPSVAASVAASWPAKRPTKRARPVLTAGVAGVAAGLAALASSCFSSDTGYDPPSNSFYFPTGLNVSPDKTTLFVTNSDFDLQYSGGTVFALDLGRLRDERLTPLLTELNTPTQAMNDVCKAFGSLPHEDNKKLFSNENDILNPGPCNPAPTKQFTDGRNAIIGAFASGAVLVTGDDPETPDVEPGERLFVAVRGDPSLTFFDVTSGSLTCHRTGARCNAESMVGVAPFDNTRRLVLPVEPVGIAASEDGKAIVVTHQTEQAVSLSVNRFGAARGPTLEHVFRNLPVGPSDVAAVPVPRLARSEVSFNYQPGFLVTYRTVAQIDLFRFTADETTDKMDVRPRPFLSRVDTTPISVNADGKDSRGIAIDASERKECEARCGAADTACLQPCVDIPLRLFVANRGPASLLVGKIETKLTPEITPEAVAAKATGAFDEVSIHDTVPLAFGPSKVVVGKVIGLDGKLHVRVFAAAFDSRLIFSYDPEAHRVDAVIRTGRGPHALVVDTSDDLSHALLYIGHFTDSYLGVVDLDMRNRNTFGTMFASVGKLQPPQESK
jgi:hypothetical protein